MQEYVTLFDTNYLPRGLVLYRSLARTVPDFRLRVVCLDLETASTLQKLELPWLETIPLVELEAAHPELLAVKSGRSRTEYAWTLTPASCLFALERDSALQEITYLDADLMFFADPEPFFSELNGDSVLITPHRFSTQWQHLEPLSGTYNVQFMTFRRDDRGLATLRWWHERCIEWCFQRHEDGKFGDQKYLDDWPKRFAGIHVLEHPGGGLAPWNVANHELADRTVDGRQLVFFHYHGLHLHRTIRRTLDWRIDYPTTESERELLWNPYIRELERAVADVQPLLPTANLGVEPYAARAQALAIVRRLVPRRARRLLRESLAALLKHGSQEILAAADQDPPA